MYQLKRYATPQNITMLLAGLGILLLWAKIKGFAKAIGEKFSPEGVQKAVVEGSKAHAVSMANNPVTSGIFAAIALKGAKDAAKKATTALTINKAFTDNTPQRISRAKQLLKEFQTKKTLRVKVLQNVSVNVVTFDFLKATRATGEKRMLKKGEILDRPNGFLQTTTLEGMLVFTDMKKQYSVNPNLVTLV